MDPAVMDTAIIVLMLVLFFSSMIGIGIYCRKKSTDVNGFVLGGRSVGPWLTAFAYGTSYFSAVVFVGYAGKFGWNFGTAATWAGVGNAIIGSLLAWAVLGRRTWRMSQHLGSSTMPQFFEGRFGSKALKLASAIIIFVFLIPYTASLYNGLSRLFGMAFDVPYEVCVIVMAVLTAVYVIIGGYMATAISDFIQGMIMLFGIVAVIIAVLNQKGGLVEAFTSLSQVSEGNIAAGSFTSLFGPDPVNLLGVVLLTSLGTWGLPQMVTKFYAIKNEKAINKGMIISSVFALIVAGGCYFLGGFGRLFFASTEEMTQAGGFDNIVPTMLGDLPAILIGIVLVLVLSASMSTLSSLVMTSSSTLTLDFIKGTVIKKFPEKNQLLIIRLLIVVFVAISVAIAIIQHNSNVSFIAELMSISWGTLAGAFLAPFLYSLYWKRISALSVWFSFAFSVIVMLLNMLANDWFPQLLKSPVNAGVFCMLAGLVIVPLVSLISKPPKKEYVEEVFSCYKKSEEEVK